MGAWQNIRLWETVEKIKKIDNFLIGLIRYSWGARGIMAIVVGNGHSDMSSNPGQDWLHFT